MASGFHYCKSVRVAAADSPDQSVATGTNVVVRGMHIALDTGGTGSIELRGGGSGGSADHELDTANEASAESVQVPGGGLEPLDGLHVTLSNVTAVTIFYEEV